MVTTVTTFFRVCCFVIRETTIVFLYRATTTPPSESIPLTSSLIGRSEGRFRDAKPPDFERILPAQADAVRISATREAAQQSSLSRTDLLKLPHPCEDCRAIPRRCANECSIANHSLSILILPAKARSGTETSASPLSALGFRWNASSHGEARNEVQVPILKLASLNLKKPKIRRTIPNHSRRTRRVLHERCQFPWVCECQRSQPHTLGFQNRSPQHERESLERVSCHARLFQGSQSCSGCKERHHRCAGSWRSSQHLRSRRLTHRADSRQATRAMTDAAPFRTAYPSKGESYIRISSLDSSVTTRVSKLTGVPATISSPRPTSLSMLFSLDWAGVSDESPFTVIVKLIFTP